MFHFGNQQDVSSAPAPRLCHVVKWRQDSGYGFHLLADKKRTGNIANIVNSPIVSFFFVFLLSAISVYSGHYIGKVDPGTPAEAGGLKVNDRIIEVNGANVVNESHAQIVERIKSVPNETRLLVLDPEADAYYEQRNILVTSAQSNVIYMKTPPLRPVSASYSSGDENDNRVQMRRRANRSQVLKSLYLTVTLSRFRNRAKEAGHLREIYCIVWRRTAVRSSLSFNLIWRQFFIKNYVLVQY